MTRPMRYFSGFPSGRLPLTPLPDLLFTDLIPTVDDLLELKITLLVLWLLAHKSGEVAPWVEEAELLAHPAVREATGSGEEEARRRRLKAALDRAVARGVLLRVVSGEQVRYFANSERGRKAVEALRQGYDLSQVEVESRPNIYTLYEENIGPLTALIAEELREAEETYPADWIEEAFREAVRMNKRNWKYVHAILKNRAGGR